MTAPVRHLTEAQLADREGVDIQTARTWRKNGTGPRYMLLAESRTKKTIRYPLAEIEKWEESLIVRPQGG